VTEEIPIGDSQPCVLSKRAQEFFEQLLEDHTRASRDIKTEHLKAKYGQSFEPDFDDPNVIGRWVRQTEQDYRARWVGSKWVYDKVGPPPGTVVISTLSVQEAG